MANAKDDVEGSDSKKSTINLELCTQRIDFSEIGGDWRGDCGAGYFEQSEDDIFPSITGCYNPEERFTDDDAVPRDDILMLNEDCNKPIEYFRNDNIDGNSRADMQRLTCLAPEIYNYLDDLDNFCGDYKKFPMKDISDALGYNAKGFGGDGCYQTFEKPAISAFSTDDRWLPPAYYTQKMVSRNACGEYGFDDFQILKQYQPAAGHKNAFNPFNIYQDDIVPDFWDSSQDASKQGRKAKNQQCLKAYIEGWAHRGDCGEIVLKGASPGVSAGS